MDITCPKCAYARQPADTAPEWQCPSCGVAYNKVAPKPVAEPASPATPVELPLQYTVVEDRAGRRMGVKWILGLVALAMVGYMGYQLAAAGRAAAVAKSKANATKQAAAKAVNPVARNYEADFRDFRTFLDAWQNALQSAYDASRTLPASGQDTPEFKAAMRHLDEMQQGWKTIQFRTACYRDNQALFADVLLTDRTHINSYATAAEIPDDVASARMVELYTQRLNACLPPDQQVTNKTPPGKP